jgi:hypothetical protein
LPAGTARSTVCVAIKHLLGTSFDHAPETLSWPWAGLDPLRLSLQVQVIRAVMVIGGKVLLTGTLDREIARERDRERILADPTRREFGDDASDRSDRTGKTRPRGG